MCCICILTSINVNSVAFEDLQYLLCLICIMLHLVIHTFFSHELYIVCICSDEMYLSLSIIFIPFIKMVIKQKKCIRKPRIEVLNYAFHTLIFHDLGINILNYSKQQNVWEVKCGKGRLGEEKYKMCSEVVQCRGSAPAHPSGWPSGSGEVTGNKQKVKLCPVQLKRVEYNVINVLVVFLRRSLLPLHHCAFLPWRNLLLENSIVKDLFSGNPNELILCVWNGCGR